MGWGIKKDSDYKASEHGVDPYRPFPPLEAGSYAVAVYEAKAGEFKSEANKGKPNVSLSFKVLPGQPGAGRFLRGFVGVFPKWGPTAKNPQGSDNFTFFNFFSAVLGKSEKEFRQWFDESTEEEIEAALPSAKELGGRKAVVKVKVVPDEYGYAKTLAQFRKDEELEAAVDSDELREAFFDRTGYTQADFNTNEIVGYKVYDGTLPGAGAANTSAPKVAAVEL